MITYKKIPMTSKSTLLRAFIATTLSVLLVACGGGGGGSTVGTNFSIMGTAATGAAISSGTVEAKCKSGTGTATTNYDGTFTVDISNGFLPCMLKATDPVSKLSLHSVVETGATTTNISPATELVTATLLGNTPSLVFADFSSSAQEKISTPNIANAVATFQAATAVLGSDADMTGIDVMKGSLSAATELAPGNPADKKIDALMSALAAADKKVSDLTTLMKSATSSADAVSGLRSVVGTAVDSLPSCPNARSGDVWVFGIVGGAPLAYTADFKNMRLTKQSTNTNYTVNQLLDSDNKVVPCAFTSTIGGITYEYRISDGGLIVAYTPTGGILIIPAQKNHKLNDASFAGSYPAMAFIKSKTSSLRFALPIRFEVDAAGTLTGYTCDLSKAVPDCLNAVNDTNKDTVNCVANADGTFSCSSSSSGFQATAAVYATGSQATLLMSITNMNINNVSYAGMVVMTKAGQMSLPTVDMSSKAGATWTISSSGSNVYTTESSATKVTAVNITKNSFTTSVTTGNNTYIGEYYLDTPAKGFIYSEYSTSKGIQLRSPSGWSVGASKPTNSTNYSDWSASIRMSR